MYRRRREINMDNATTWKIIDTFFRDNPQALVRHHVDSYNDFYKTGIYNIFKEKNPVRLYSRLDPKTGEYASQCNLYMGGRNGDKIYFGKPVIYDHNEDGDHVHSMFPNEARLRNMTYGMTIHYDIEVEFIDHLEPGEAPTILGGELDREVLGGGIEFDQEDSRHLHSGNYKMGGELVQGGDGVDQGDSEINGGGPKPVKIKRQSKQVLPPLEMTTAAAERIREATEQSLQGQGSGKRVQRRWETLDRIYLGKFPIMVQSDFCVLHGLPTQVRHTMGECRNDLGGYFIIDGKEKTVIAQEKFADNMLYVRAVKDEHYTYSADIRSVSENASKPVRTFSVKLCADTARYKGGNIVVNIPNVRKPVPLFIVFRALGILSDKAIIEHCVLDLDKYESMVDLFIPSVHDAGAILTQQNALKYIGLLTKGKTVTHALEILSDYFLPHIGEINYIPKAFALGHMVFRLLSVSTGMEIATDRDNFKYKRLELVGTLLYDLFRDYWNIQLRQVHLEFEKRLYYNQAMYERNLYGLILQNYPDVFKERALEAGFRKAFKGNWGAYAHTKRIGVIQDLNRLSFNSALDHLRKTSLPLDSSVKLVGPRVLHNSQWGFIDPIDTPDGGSIGLHKHLAISTYVTRGVSREPMIAWMREKWGMKLVEEFAPKRLAAMTKVIINGCWIGVVSEPVECVQKFRLYRRNALVPVYASAAFDIQRNTIFVYTDAGRLCRPIFYRDELTGRPSYLVSKRILTALREGDFSWTDLVAGFNKRRTAISLDLAQMKIYELNELYEGVETETNPAKLERFLKDKAVLDYIDTSESETAMVALHTEDFEGGKAETEESNALVPKGHKSRTKGSADTHCEIHNSFILGMMCNMIIFPENNPSTRNSFSCGQSKQACSLYHTNYQVRMDKAAVLLNYGQIPLVKSRFLDHITHEENAYGENAIVAIACYSGYNVEDAILINEGAIKRGLFRTTYFSSYEAHEETTKNVNTMVDRRFMNIEANPDVVGLKPGYDYSQLDEYGLIRQGTPVDDKTVLIGLATVGSPSAGSAIAPTVSYRDESKTPKKGQLGIVDRVFITDGEEGQRIAKVRVLEQRIPNLGDKMASRAGQKGTIGMVIPERDMPFTKDGIRPDLIINPHAIPTRMTIGQLVECVTGKACVMMGGFGDCTAFNTIGSKIGAFGELLSKQGFHSSGNEVLYNGMTGEQIESEIFMGPTYYMRLKHMVKDKINYRALGPRAALTKQPVGGRANDGGLRIGEMERDTLISHGMTDFLRESMMERGDKSYVAICNLTGMISIYNPAKGLMMSPMADGPLRFTGSVENDNLRIEHITKYGRNFSVVCIPYSLKLMIQELLTIGVQMRILTDETVDQIETMAYSNNMYTLMNQPPLEDGESTKASREHNTRSLIDAIKQSLAERRGKGTDQGKGADQGPKHDYETKGFGREREKLTPMSPWTDDGMGIMSPPMAVTSPAYQPAFDEVYLGEPPNPDSPQYNPLAQYGGSEETWDDQDQEQVGNTHSLQVGARVGMRGVTDGYPARPWRITHVGDRFITARAEDTTGLSEDASIRVVSPMDVFPYEQLMAQSMMHNQGQTVGHGQGPIQAMGQATPPTIIHISPTLVNGDNNKVEQEAAPNGPSVSTMPVTVSASGQDIGKDMVIRPSIDKTPSVNEPSTSTAASSVSEPDFANAIIIKKLG